MSLKRVRQSEWKKNPMHWVLLGIALCAGFASHVLADSTLTYVSVTSQNPGSISPGQSATYTVTANRTGNGSLDVYLSVTGLPAGASASFSAGVVSFVDDTPSAKSATLTISTTDATPPGVYPFTITGRHGNSSKFVTCTGVLVIGSGALVNLPQRIIAIDCQAEGNRLLTCSGEGLHSYVVQASSTLVGNSWTNLGMATADSNGIFTYLDATAGACSCRFYRTSTP